MTRSKNIGTVLFVGGSIKYVNKHGASLAQSSEKTPFKRGGSESSSYSEAPRVKPRPHPNHAHSTHTISIRYFEF